MTPGRASASGFHYGDPFREGGGSYTGDSDPFWGYGAEGENASASTCRWGDVSVVEPGALESPLSFYSPEYESSPLSPSFLFQAPPSRAAGTAALPADIRQLSASESEPSPEPAQKLTRKRLREVEQAVALPAVKKTADRTAQIADFTWTLPPDPGSGGRYPSLTFLVGAAISSSDSGMMTMAGIRQWIRARYPSRPKSDNAINNALTRQAGFIHIHTGLWDKGLWKLCNPQQFGGYYEKNMFLSQRGINVGDEALRAMQPAPEQSSPGGASPTLSVKFGDHILTLPDYGASRKKPSLKLLCGCAIALSSEQGLGVNEIAEWVANRYPVQGTGTLNKLKTNIRAALRVNNSDFRPTDILAPRTSKRGPDSIRWVLKNPADFAARYEASKRGGTGRPSSGVGTGVASSGDICQPTRKRPRKAEPSAVLPCAKTLVDRTVQIAGFTWTLPPDPGPGGPYPSLTFLIGAAIASSDSGIMKQAEIRQWIGARYPSKPISTYETVNRILNRTSDFNNTRLGKGRTGLWMLRNPHQFRRYYEKGIIRKHRYGITSERALGKVRPASEQDQGAASSVLSVRFGDRTLTLYSTGQEKPPLRLLCGCAIALGPEQGSSVTEIVEWITDYYSIQEASSINKLKDNTRTTLNVYSNDFRRTDVIAPMRSKKGGASMKWVLKSPADFAASYGGHICSQDS